MIPAGMQAEVKDAYRAIFASRPGTPAWAAAW